MVTQMAFENPKIKEIIDYTRKIWALNHASGLMGWDMEVNMPPQGARERSIAMGEISMMEHSFVTNDKFVKMVEAAKSEENLNKYEQGLLRVLSREIKQALAIPREIVGELSRVTGEATMAWREAREKNDYEKFRPYLDKIIELERKIADYLGYEKHPYDALADLYEEGMTVHDYDEFFGKIEGELKDILTKIMNSGWPKEHPLEKEKYDKDALHRVNLEIVKLLGYPLDERGRLDISAHPFTIGLGIGDVRITTRYEGIDFKKSLLAVVHEFGHSLYELQIDPQLSTTPLAHGVSSGIHESQSRFWENMVGRNMRFVERIYSILRENLSFLASYSPEEVYRYFNTVKPSLIRVDADEVTYNMHILVRYSIEKMMIAGEIKTSEIPEIWNEKMEEYLGVRPKSYSEGVLQDIHWSGGSIGYFPTYSLGTVLAVQIGEHARRDIGNFEDVITGGDLSVIREYLRNKVHRYGSVYAPKDLLRRSFGEEIEPEYFLKYLKQKYLS